MSGRGPIPVHGTAAATAMSSLPTITAVAVGIMAAAVGPDLRFRISHVQAAEVAEVIPAAAGAAPVAVVGGAAAAIAGIDHLSEK